MTWNDRSGCAWAAWISAGGTSAVVSFGAAMAGRAAAASAAM
jgi:hypothetical protein